MAKVTLQSIADRVGVSRMTVSNAFSRPDQLSADLRAKILAAADELGYVGPDPAARALARGRTGSVGVLLTDQLSDAFRDQVATEFLSSIADALTREGLALTLLTSGDVVGAPSGHIHPTSPGSSAAGCRWSRWTATPTPTLPASTSTTGPERGPLRSTSSSSATRGSPC
jgi:hypothetical protein